MPTYEYVCRSCSTHLEVVQRFDDASLTECPTCGGALRKVFGNIGIAFKGSGFYKNDSRSVAGSRSAAKVGEGSGKDSGGGSGQDGAKAGSGKKEAASTSSSSSTSSTPATKSPAAKSA